MKVCVFVLTYNRLSLLQECIDCLRKQTVMPTTILVIDNGSSDGTALWLKQQHDLEVLTVPLNEGAANGFGLGFKYAIEHNYDWTWCMDDDTLPSPTAYEAFLNFLEDKVGTEHKPIGFLASEVLWTDGSLCKSNLPHFVTGSKSELRLATFVSTLYNVQVLKQVGPIIKNFYQWYVDAEFTFRIAKDFLCFNVSDSKVIHKTKENVVYSWNNVSDELFSKFATGITNYVFLYSNNYFNESASRQYRHLIKNILSAYFYTIKQTHHPLMNAKTLTKNILKGFKMKPEYQ